MDAADDPGETQLCWPLSGEHRRPKIAGAFDLFEDIPGGFKELEDTLPPTVQVHDIAADDDIPAAAPDLDGSDAFRGRKQFQDDMSSRLPWADVVDDNDFQLDGIEDETAAEFISHDHRAQRGPFKFDTEHQVVNEQHKPCASDDAGTQGFDRTTRSIFAASTSELSQDLACEDASTPAGLPCLVGQGYGDPCICDVKTQSDIPVPDASDVFLDHARLVLPDVHSDSCEEELSPDGVEEDDVGDRLDFGSQDHDIGTQCGPLPQHMLWPHPLNSTPQMQLQSKIFGSLDHDLGTQCGQLPQPFDGRSKDYVTTTVISPTSVISPTIADAPHPVEWAPQMRRPALSSRDEGAKSHLKDFNVDEFDYESLNIFDLVWDADGSLKRTETQCRPLPQQPTSRTQFEPLDLQPLEDSRAQLLAVSLAPSSSIEARVAALEAYAAATHESLGRFCSEDFPCVKFEPLQQQHTCPEDGKAEDSHVILLADALGISASNPHEGGTSIQGKAQKAKKKRRKARR